jgi:hypothetical protein
MFVISYNVVPDRLLQPSLMFEGKARSLLKSGAPERRFTQIGSSPTCKFWTGLEKFVKDKRSSLFRPLRRRRRKKFKTSTADLRRNKIGRTDGSTSKGRKRRQRRRRHRRHRRLRRHRRRRRRTTSLEKNRVCCITATSATR